MRKDIIKNKIKEILESLELISDNLPASFDEFQNLGIVKDGIYKRIEYAIENLIDIFYIINADLELGIPEDDSSMIDNLEHKNIISISVRNLMKNMKGFRNVVVHRYGKIDDKLAYTFIKENMGDFEIVIKCIENIIDRYQ
jgi:uncharacterized protein YutE (UPF0331/DUF86 family)